MKSCFGYVRVSTAKQGEGVSLEAQRDAILAFANRNDLQVISWFEEKETAAKAGRPIFSAMMKALHKGEAQGLIIHKIDRSARNFADWAKIGELSDQGIDVHIASETLDFRSRGGRLSADIQAVIAADYIRNLREETKKGINGRLKQGLYPFKAPIGYCDNGGGKAKTRDPVRGPLIIKAFELYGSGGYSICSLRLHMETLGLRNGYDRPVSKGGIEQILSNPFYAGTIKIKRTGMTYAGIHEPLIAQSLFDRVQDVKAGRSGKKVTKHLHTYRGLFQCQYCKLAMIPERQKGHVYYRCHTPDCLTKCVREEGLEVEVLNILSRTVLTDSDVHLLTAEVAKWIEEKHACAAPNTTPMQIAVLEQKLDRLTDALIDRVIDNDAYAKRKQTILLEVARLKESQLQEKKTANAEDVRRFLELIKNLAVLYVVAKPVEKREMLENTTSNRFVAGKNICVEPQDWLVETQESVTALIGALHRPTSRSSHRVKTQHIETLLRSVSSGLPVNLLKIATTQTNQNVSLYGATQLPLDHQDHR